MGRPGFNGQERSPPERVYARMPEPAKRARPAPSVPADVDDASIEVDGRRVTLTNLRKVYFPKLALTKGDLLRYYLSVAGALLPHVANRPMVMKRYPHGVTGDFFYMKRTPSPRPEWIRTCTIEHRSGNVIDFPVIDDRASLLWMINLGCIDLNPWYALCDDPNRPLYIHFDLDPTPETPFSVVREGALIVADVLRGLRMTPFVKTTGSKGVHIYVAIRIGPTQHEVWEIAKEIGHQMARAHPDVLTAEYRVAKRPEAPRAGRLQSERLGPHAGVYLFGARERGRDGLHAGRVVRDRGRLRARRLHHVQRRRAHRASAICGSRCSRAAAASNLRFEALLLRPPIEPMETRHARAHPRGTGVDVRAEVGRLSLHRVSRRRRRRAAVEIRRVADALLPRDRRRTAASAAGRSSSPTASC